MELHLSKGGVDHAGNPLVTVTPTGSAPYEIDMAMMFCLLGVSRRLPTYRAGTCARLKVRGLVEGHGDNWSLTAKGEQVLPYCKSVIIRFVGGRDA